ncbi:MAG: hypothetical protein MZV49_08895 [Rhodopseudomonas palustris]|nr:hypothetical protein [Rhodopseudomonas palustris]
MSGILPSGGIGDAFGTSFLGASLALSFPYGRMFDGVPVVDGLGFQATADWRRFPAIADATRTGGTLDILSLGVLGTWSTRFPIPVNATAHGGFRRVVHVGGAPDPARRRG